MFTKVTLPAVIGAIIIFGNQLVTVLPPVWGNLLGAILGIVALYYHGQVVKAARLAGVRGI